MIIQTTRFGKLEIDDNQIITMPNGLLGFSGNRLYAILDDEVGSPFKWFQSIENEALAFVTIDPRISISDYAISISDEQLKKLHCDAAEDLDALVIVTMTRDLKDVTINLQGPLVLNMKKRIGAQMVIPDGKYSTRHPLFGDRLNIEELQEGKHKSAENASEPLKATG